MSGPTQLDAGLYFRAEHTDHGSEAGRCFAHDTHDAVGPDHAHVGTYPSARSFVQRQEILWFMPRAVHHLGRNYTVFLLENGVMDPCEQAFNRCVGTDMSVAPTGIFFGQFAVNLFQACVIGDLLPPREDSAHHAITGADGLCTMVCVPVVQQDQRHQHEADEHQRTAYAVQEAEKVPHGPITSPALGVRAFGRCVHCPYSRIRNWKRSMFFNAIPVPRATARKGSSLTCTGSLVLMLIRLSNPRSKAPPPAK